MRDVCLFLLALRWCQAPALGASYVGSPPTTLRPLPSIRLIPCTVVTWQPTQAKAMRAQDA